MSKAILVMDMPSTCLGCPLKYKSEEMHLGNFTYQSLYRCGHEPDGLDEDEGDMVYLNDIMMKGKPEWCPLKEMPSKKESLNGIGTTEGMGYNNGYNACIDEILKGAEENEID